MPKNNQTRGVSSELLTVIISALAEHEKEIDRLISGLGELKDGHLANSKNLDDRMDRIGRKIAVVQSRIDVLKRHVSAEAGLPVKISGETAESVEFADWGDFQGAAVGADKLRFVYEEEEKSLRVEAAKGSLRVMYCVEAPALSALLQAWLAKQLKISDAGNVRLGADEGRVKDVVASSHQVGQ
jgi:hypothetical protein